MSIKNVRIIGSGLIGTSIGLGLAAKNISVEMVDIDEKAQKLAQDLVGKTEAATPNLVIFALPTSALSSVLNSEYELNPTSRFMDIGSVKTKPLLEVSKSELPLNRFCPTHPMAGREVGGPESARGDLFDGRPWIISSNGVDDDVLLVVNELISLLGSKAFNLEVGEHDGAVALISHLPQLTSSLLAKQLIGADEKWLELAGAGLRDTTRIAASDSKLWSEIIAQNSKAIVPLLEKMADDLAELISEIKSQVPVNEFIDTGNTGRALIPGKHGGAQRNYVQLPIVIEDKPGQLGALFNECDAAQVNVEDLTIEHTPGQFTGLITLSLSESDAQTLEEHLKKSGWNVHSPR